MADHRDRCAHCKYPAAAHAFPKASRDPAVCGDFLRSPYVEPPRSPLTRDSLLHEIARSLRATHPDRCEELIAAVEARMPGTPLVYQTVGGPIELVDKPDGMHLDQIEEIAALCAERMWPVPVALPIRRDSLDLLLRRL